MSAAQIDKGARFRHRGGRDGILFLHGFTGSPYEMRFLAEGAATAGYTVDVPVLPGHGTTPGDLATTSYEQWIDCARSAVHELQNDCDKVMVVGQSMGGLLAIDLAAARLCDSVALFAVPLRLPGVSGVVARLLPAIPTSLLRRLPPRSKAQGSDVLDAAVKKENPGYRVLPLAGVAELATLMAKTPPLLSAVRCPALVVHGKNDHTAPASCAATLLAELGSADKSLLMLERSFHLISADVEKFLVAKRLTAFATRTLTGQSLGGESRGAARRGS